MSESQLQEAKAIFQILSSVYEQSPWTLEQIKADLGQETTEYYFIQADGEIVAFMSLLHLLGETELTNIAVRKDYQGKGYARQLLQKLEGISQPVFLEVRKSNHKAQHLYQLFGFSVLGQRKAYYHNPVEDALIMRKEM